MDNIEWLFFDVGSTLVNEEKAYLHRLQDVADAVNEPFEKIYDKAISFYKENRKGDSDESWLAAGDSPEIQAAEKKLKESLMEFDGLTVSTKALM